MKNKTQISIRKLIFFLLFSLAANTSLFSQDTKSPIPICVNESMVNLINGSVNIKASDLNVGSYDNLTPQSDLRFTFSEVKPADDPEYDFLLKSSVKTLSGSANTTIILTMYVWDSYDNYDYCSVYVKFVDNIASKGYVHGQFGYPTDIFFQTYDLGINVNVKLENAFNPLQNKNFISLGKDFAFNNLKTGTYKLSARSNEDRLKGITTLDFVLIIKHLLQIRPIIKPTMLFAADVRKDGEINVLDLIQMRRLILGKIDSLPQNSSWRFGNVLQVFEPGQNPLKIGLQEQIFFSSNQDSVIRNFIPIKIGDLNNTGLPASCSIEDADEFDLKDHEVLYEGTSSLYRVPYTIENITDTVYFNISDYLFEDEQEICIPVTVKNCKDIAGFQIPISWDKNVLKFSGIKNPFAGGILYNQPNSDLGEVNIIWYDEAAGVVNLQDNAVLFDIYFNVLDHNQSSTLSFESRNGFQSGVYDLLEPLPLILNNGQIEFGEGCIPYKIVSLGVYNGISPYLHAESFYKGEENGDKVLVNGETGIYFYCDDIGEREVLVTVKFANGDTTSCTSLVKVEDNSPPTIIVNSEIDLTLNSNLSNIVPPEMIDNGSYDNCSEISLSVYPSILDCDSPNPTTLTLTATDKSGNSNIAFTKVNIQYPDHPANFLVCDDKVMISVPQNGDVEITADMILAGWITCPGYYQIKLFDDINSTFPKSDNILDYSEIGTYYAKVIDPKTLNFCWSEIIIYGIQNSPVKFILPEVTVGQYEDFCVGMTVKNFNNLTQFQVPISWDDKVLQFQRIEIPENSVLKSNLYHNNIGNEMRILWFGGESLNIADGTKIFNLCFKVIGGSGTIAELVDSSLIGDFRTKVYNGNGNLVDHVFVNGKINIQNDGCVSNLQVNLDEEGEKIIDAKSFYFGEKPDEEILVNGEPSIYFSCADIGTQEVWVSVKLSEGSLVHCFVIVEIIDDFKPIAVCNDNIQVTLDQIEQTRVPALDFEFGSFDNCNSVHFKVMRVLNDIGCTALNGDDDPITNDSDVWYDDEAAFCCEDILSDTSIIVSLRVFDIAPGVGPIDPKRMELNGDLYGHFDDCWTKVKVIYGIDPAINCPSVTVSCEESLDPYVNTKILPQVLGLCDLGLTYTDVRDSECSVNITRIWMVKGTGKPTTCEQNITLEKAVPFDPCTIVFPNDTAYTISENNPNISVPFWNKSSCNFITADIINEDTFNYVDGACYKVLREWAVIDWCKYKLGTNAEINVDALVGVKLNCDQIVEDGYYKYTQIIKIDCGTFDVCTFTVNGEPIENVKMVNSYFTDLTGCVDMKNIPLGTEIKPEKADSWLDGVDVLDVLLLDNYLLGLSNMNPYQRIAGDLNDSKSCSSSDVISIEKIILEKSNPTSSATWVFIDSKYNLNASTDIYNYPNYITYTDPNLDYEFTGLKKGDIYNSSKENYLVSKIKIKDAALNKGEIYQIPVLSNQNYDLRGIQFSLEYDTTKIKIKSIYSDDLSLIKLLDKHRNFKSNRLNFLYWSIFSNIIEKDDILFNIEFEAINNSVLSQSINLIENRRNLLVTEVKTYSLDIEWQDKISSGTNVIGNDFVMTIYPQPAKDILMLGFTDESIIHRNFTITDIVGQKIQSNSLIGNTIDVSGLTNGIYLLHVNYDNGKKAVKKFLINK
jgi:hypothetical protein